MSNIFLPGKWPEQWPGVHATGRNWDEFMSSSEAHADGDEETWEGMPFFSIDATLNVQS